MICFTPENQARFDEMLTHYPVKRSALLPALQLCTLAGLQRLPNGNTIVCNWNTRDDGDREGAQRAFSAMAEREDTRLLGLRGLFIEAQRADDPIAVVGIAEEALKLAPASTWASRSWFVAAITRTSACIVLLLPTRSNSRS